MANMSDPLAWWSNALTQPNMRDRAPVDINRPEAGYYRYRLGKSKWQALRIMWEKGEVYGCVGAEQTWLDETEIGEKFAIAYRYPISIATYEHFIKTGKWLDIDEEVERQVSIGDNRPPQDDFEQFKIDIETAALAVERYKEIGDDEALGRARSAQARLTELAGQADKKRVEIKAPALKECTDIDAAWQPIIKLARFGASALGRYMGLWEDKKEAALEALREAQRREADRAIAEGVPPSAQEAPTPAEPLPPPRTQVKGGYGRAGHVHVRKIVNRMMPIDWDGLFRRYGEDTDVRTLLIGKAERDLNNGHDVPGVTVTTERIVK